MRRKLKETLKKSQSQHSITQSKIKCQRSNFKKLQEQNEEDLCKIYFNVMSRPFLFEDVSSQKHKVNQKHDTTYTIPLKKKGRKGKPSPNHLTSKHIHQSPLKVMEADNYDQTTENKKPSAEHARPYSEDDSSHPYINQSF